MKKTLILIIGLLIAVSCQKEDIVDTQLIENNKTLEEVLKQGLSSKGRILYKTPDSFVQRLGYGFSMERINGRWVNHTILYSHSRQVKVDTHANFVTVYTFLRRMVAITGKNVYISRHSSGSETAYDIVLVGNHYTDEFCRYNSKLALECITTLFVLTRNMNSTTFTDDRDAVNIALGGGQGRWFIRKY